MQTLSHGNMRRFRIRYMLAKLTRDFDLRAYGAAAALNEYVRSENDVEHILPESPWGGPGFVDTKFMQPDLSRIARD